MIYGDDPDNTVPNQSAVIQSGNLYVYCSANPIKYKDTNGQWIHLAIGAAIGGVIGAASTAISLVIENKMNANDPSYIPHSTTSIVCQSIVSFATGDASGLLSSIGIPGGMAIVADATFGAIEGAANTLIDEIERANSLNKDVEVGELIGKTVVKGIEGACINAVFSCMSDPTDGKLDQLYDNYKTKKLKMKTSTNPRAKINFEQSSASIKYKGAIEKFSKETTIDGLVNTVANQVVTKCVDMFIPEEQERDYEK